ncbi:MAG: ABC transporter ATP-binding protein [Dehalococcoidales bacterium]|nr:ABC transporter ATP-binding protein [Dehalococcoidales bacterium]
MLLEIKGLDVYYEQARAVSGISLNVNEGEIISIVGANGAGKTTLLKTISGLKKPASGEIWFKGKRIEKMQANQITKLGIIQIPAGREIFPEMSVSDNLKVGAYLRKDRKKISQDLEAIYNFFPILKEKQKQMGGRLSGGQQQMLAIGRALMADPILLLMDEPTIGLSPILVSQISKIIKDINGRGISIILVEQNCRIALKLANRGYILENGSVSLEGYSGYLAGNELVKKCYLGG